MANPPNLGSSYSEPKINCEICLKEVPQSEAKSTEAEEYIIWFCGLECYEKWRNAKDNPKEKKYT
jgi:hypothetical protein